MKAYAVFWVDNENFLGVVTSETDKTTDQVLDLFITHYPEHEPWRDKDILFVTNQFGYVHSV